VVHQPTIRGRTDIVDGVPLRGEYASRNYVAGDVVHGYGRDAGLAGRSRHRDFCIFANRNWQVSVIALGPVT
jgi:hypothetical protein